MKHLDLMLDLETLSTDPQALVFQVAAVPFCFDIGMDLPSLPVFNELIHPSSSLKVGSKIDSSTVEFWLKQDHSVINLVLTTALLEGQDLRIVLEKFNSYIENLKEHCNVDRVCLWGNGVKSDNVWLENQYRLAGMQYPVTFRDDMDIRTLKLIGEVLEIDTSKKEIPFEGQPHNAIDDCNHQIKQVLKIRNCIKKIED